MSKEKGENKIDFDGDFAHEYDEIAQKIIPGYEEIYLLTHHLLREKLDDNAKILVAGSGTGKELIDYSLSNSTWSVTGFDPAEKMIAVARSKIIAASLQDRISLVSGYIDDVVEKNFDAGISILVMHFLRDDGAKLEFLKKIGARLKDNAPFILVDLEGEARSNEYETFKNAWKNQQLFTRNDRDRVQEEFKIREKEVHYIPQTRIESLLEKAGFTNVYKFFKAYLFGGYIATRIN